MIHTSASRMEATTHIWTSLQQFATSGFTSSHYNSVNRYQIYAHFRYIYGKKNNNITIFIYSYN